MKIINSLLYKILCILLCAIMACSLIFMVSAMPPFASAENPTVNEVSEKYLTDSIKDTGAISSVAGMILDYRAFDTLGESCVLFVATISVFILLRADEKKKNELELELQESYEPEADPILTTTFKAVVPIILIFGAYIVMNGHLSPGGGFAGGAILAGAFILYLNAYGYEKANRIINRKTYTVLSCCALSFYCLAKSYSFYTGANGIHSIIKPGTPGSLISGGLILPLNICVGIVVCCTISAIYIMFKKGGVGK